MNVDRIRRDLIQLRKALSPEDVQRLSQTIAHRFLSFFGAEEIKALSLNIGLYQAMPFEPSLEVLETEFKKSGSRLFYPRVIDQESRLMEFVEANPAHQSPQDWKMGPYGIREPQPELKNIIQPNQLDVIFVPGVAFGPAGERIGMGVGYYDRFLAKVDSALRVALVFDFQILPSLHQSSTDQAVHWIVSERRNIKLPAADSLLMKFIEVGIK